MPNFAFVISSHGYGHAARACAVMQAILKQQSNAHFLLFTQVPQWFFADSLPSQSFSYFNIFTDVGLVQRSPFEEDLPETLRLLQKHIPFAQSTIEQISLHLKQKKVKAVLTDISGLGILAAQKAGLPSVLIENFTWDWIYRYYLKAFPALHFFIEYFHDLYQKVDWHFKTVPFASPTEQAIVVPPVARRPRLKQSQIRQLLKLNSDRPVVLISTGGIATRHPFVSQLKTFSDYVFVIPHQVPQAERHKNLIILPHRSGFYHPDLVQAADIVVCKAGYSTLAETYLQQKPVLLVGRPHFPESSVLENFVQKENQGKIVEPREFNEATWVTELPALLQHSALLKAPKSGAERIAQKILSLS